MRLFTREKDEKNARERVQATRDQVGLALLKMDRVLKKVELQTVSLRKEIRERSTG